MIALDKPVEEQNEEEVPLSDYDQIKLNLKTAHAALLSKQNDCTRIKKELSKAEDFLVEANEAVRAATEALQDFEQTKIANVVDEDLREVDVERFKSNLPELMKLIDNEAPIVLKVEMMKEEEEDSE